MQSRFKSTPYKHSQKLKVGVLITNLGTPDEPTTGALRKYLREFLSDPRVVEIPRMLWLVILHLIILRVRPAKSAAAYRTVWTDRGSPLRFHTLDQREKLSAALKSRWGDDILVEYAMRYGEPSISNALDDLLAKGASKIVVLPMYPQYSGSTTGSTFDAVAKDFTKRRWLPDLRFIANYHDHPQYIKAIANSIKNHWQKNGKPEKLVFSFHGVPLKYLHQGDPYHCQCLKTSRLVAEELNLDQSEYLTTFQSRFGKATWLKPYTDKTLIALAEQGVRNLQVVCPGFSSDCLETIEEINVENREYFEHAGGEVFSYIPALNASDEHIALLASLVEQNTQGWEGLVENQNPTQTQSLYEKCPHNKT